MFFENKNIKTFKNRTIENFIVKKLIIPSY